MGISHSQLLLQLASLVYIDGRSEELRGSQGWVTGDHVTRVVGLLHSVLFLRCVDHPHLKLFDHLPQKNMSYKIVRPYEISFIYFDQIIALFFLTSLFSILIELNFNNEMHVQSI